MIQNIILYLDDANSFIEKLDNVKRLNADKAAPIFYSHTIHNFNYDLTKDIINGEFDKFNVDGKIG